jgi:hypothetical protein
MLNRAAIVTFHLDRGHSSTGRRTLVLRKGADGWKIVHLHAPMLTSELPGRHAKSQDYQSGQQQAGNQRKCRVQWMQMKVGIVVHSRMQHGPPPHGVPPKKVYAVIQLP